MAVEVSELLTTLRLKDEATAGLAAANDRLRQVAAEASKAEGAVEAVDREFKAAGRSGAAVARSIDGAATAAAAANRVLAQHADAVAKLRIQYEREGRTATETAEALRRLDQVRDGGLAKARAAGARVEAQFIAQGVATGQATDQLSRFGSVSDHVQRSAESMASRLGGVGTAMSGFGVGGAVAAAALAAIGTGLVAIAQAGDTATATLGKLRAATGSLTAARDVYEALYQSSQKTGIAVAESAGTFQRFQIAAGEIGATRDQVLKLVDGLQKIAIVSGASGQEAGAAMQQLGQALASGKLSGDELRSLLENMPSLAQQLARELGTNIGQLRKMGEEGQLTADKVFPALLKATDKMAADFDKMPLTMSRSFDILGAAMLNFTAKLDEALGLSNLIARAAKAAADAVNGVTRIVAPTPREEALRGIATAKDTIGRFATRTANAQSEIDAYVAKGLTREQALSLAMPSLPGQTQNDGALLAKAERDLRQHQDNLTEIDKEGQQERFGQFVAAQQKAADAAKTAAITEFKAAELQAQKLLKIENDYNVEYRKIVAAEATGDVSPERIFAQRLALADKYYKDRAAAEKELAGEQDKGAKTSAAAASKEAKARDTVLAKLDAELDAKQRLANATGLGAEATAAQNVELEIENKLREAGIPITGKRTEEEQRYADRIDMTVRALETLKGADKAAADARTEATRESERATREIESQSRRIADDVATSIYEGLVEGRKGQSVIDWFGNLFKRIAIQAASTQILLPITTAIVGGIPQLFGISGAGGASGSSGGLGGLFSGGGGGLGGIGSMLSSGWNTLSSGGYLASGGGFSGALFGTPAVEAIIPGGFSSAGTSGLIGSGGSFSMGALGSTLGGIGAGFGAGQLLNSLLGGKQTGGMVGSGLGALGGAVLGSIIPGIGTLIGGLIGGAAGGGLGGLIGPGPTVNSFGFRLQSAGWGPDAAPTNTMAGSLLPVSRQYYDEAGAAQFQQADALVTAVNAYMAANGIQVAGASIVGGNKNGPDGSGFGTVAEAFANLKFGAADNEKLNAYLGTQAFDDPAKLEAAVTGFKQADAAIKALGAEAVPAFTASLKAVNDNFDAGAEAARKYGLSETELTTARAKALALLEAQRAETVRQTTADLALRRMVAGGGGQESDLAQQAEAATRELKQFTDQVKELGLDAAASAALITDMERTQAEERLGIIRRYGEQAADALRQAGGSIRQYLDGLATGTAAGASPTDRLAAAQANFDRDRILATGGDKDALGRITGSADALLSAGRDVYASGQGFQDIKGSVVSGLSALPVVQSYDAMQAASLAAIQAALETGTLNTATLILPAGNTVQLAGGLAMAGIESRLGLMIEQNQTAAVARVALHATTIQGVGVMGGIFNSLFENRQVAVAAHVTAVNQEAALYALGLIGNATNDNLYAANTIAATNATAMVATMNAGNNYLAELVRLIGVLQREVELLRAQSNDNADDVVTAVGKIVRPLERAIGS